MIKQLLIISLCSTIFSLQSASVTTHDDQKEIAQTNLEQFLSGEKKCNGEEFSREELHEMALIEANKLEALYSLNHDSLITEILTKREADIDGKFRFRLVAVFMSENNTALPVDVKLFIGLNLAAAEENPRRIATLAKCSQILHDNAQIEFKRIPLDNDHSYVTFRYNKIELHDMTNPAILGELANLFKETAFLKSIRSKMPLDESNILEWPIDALVCAKSIAQAAAWVKSSYSNIPKREKNAYITLISTNVSDKYFKFLDQNQRAIICKYLALE